MKIGIISLSAVKQTSAFFVIMVVGAVSAMNHDIVLRNQNSDVTYRSLHGFPVIPLVKAGAWWNKLSIEDKNDVHRQIVKQNDERLSALFNLVTTLPREIIRHKIALNMVNRQESVIVQEKQADEFLKLSIAQVYYYPGFLEIVQNKKNEKFKALCSKDPHFKPDTLCLLSQEIKTFSKWREVYDRMHGPIYCSKNQLEAIDKLSGTFKNSFSNAAVLDIRYHFSEVFTMDNFKKQFNREQFVGLPIILTPFIIEYVANRSCIINGLAYSLAPLIGSSIIAVGVKETFRSLVDIFFPIKEDFFPTVVACCIAGLCCFGMGSLIFWAEPELAEYSLLGIGCITGAYVYICSFHNVLKMKLSRIDSVRMNELSALLKRTDIVIK
ncbi:MAG TPA: hypothetical protein VKR54_03935 [Candidatus Babeliales bacterium]|jgi:hypothetical protein|nr:hypothetical protein [Candidatus Babeliales bacterium]